MTLVLVGVALAVHGAGADPFGATLGWQEHSKNDLRGWEQMLRKGGRNFKVDPNFRDAAFCAGQVNVAPPRDPRGCFVLNHDNPEPLLGRTRSDYNTTSELLQVIQDPKFSRYFGPPARAAHPGSPFLIALCFKNAPDACSKGGRSDDWLGLVDDFFAAAQAAIQKHQLHVAFVLDGGAGGEALCQCNRDRWRPWNATWIPPASKSSCVAAAFASNDRERGLDRFQVLNPPVGAFSSVASQGYGKFAESSANYQVYEPKDESLIVGAVDAYVSAGAPHAPGLRFAINVDSAMLQNYAARGNATGSGAWGATLVPPQNASKPRLVVVSSNSNTNLMLVAYQGAAHEAFYATYRVAGGSGSDVASVATGAMPSGPLAVEALSVAPGSPSRVLAADRTGRVVGYTLSVGGELVPGWPSGSGGSFENVTTTAALPKDSWSSTVLVSCPTSSRKVPAHVVQNAPFCAAQIAVNGHLSLRLWRLGDASPELLNETSLSAVSSGEEIQGSLTSIESINGAPVVLIAWSDASGVRAATAQWSSSTGGWDIDAGPSFIAVGRAPRVSATSGVALIVHQDGFCQNNEKRNKAAERSVCEPEPKSTPGVLVYTYARISDIQTRLRAGTQANACDPRVMHGAYGQGAAPAVALFVPSGATRPAVAAVHEGYVGGGDPDACGQPVERPGAIMLAGWQLANLDS